jgi:hypothetical protein
MSNAVPRWRALVVFALLGLYATVSWTASLSKGLSFDEGLQLAVGYNIWLNDDLRLEGANGDLIKRWATLPYLVSRPRFVGADNRFLKAGAPYELAFGFFFESGNPPEWLLQQGRAMVALLGVATALLVFWCSRAVFGFAGGIISLGLFVFSPHMLAFGGIVSTDMSIILTLFGCTWCIWRLLHEVSIVRVVLSLGFFALMVLAKPTALVILPVAAVLVTVRLIAGRALIFLWRGNRWRVTRRASQAAVIVGLIFLHALAGWSAIWAHYNFRYEASPNPADPSLRIFKLTGADEIPGGLARMLDWAEETRVLPQGYLCGIEHLLGNDDEVPSFMNGHWAIGGSAWFFPYAMWAKTQPVLMLLLALGGATWWYSRRIGHSSSPTGQTHAVPAVLYALTPYLVLAGCYGAIAMTEDLNIGHRHILPIYPCLYVLAGATGIAWRRGIGWLKITVGALFIWLVAESVAMRPHYLAYFGPQAGGSQNGFRHLVDSSLDWGMNLPGLRRWLDQHDSRQNEPLFLAYFGTDSPRYHGIESRRLPGFFDRRKVEPYALTPGYYAISATLFQSVYTMAFGPWSKAYEERYQLALQNMRVLEQSFNNPKQLLLDSRSRSFKDEFYIFDQLRFARLCAWLRHQGDPLDQVGHAILIWKLDYDHLHAALLGPPVELTDNPVPARQYGRYQPLRD